MSYILSKMLCPKGLSNNPNTNMKAINYVTIHNTGNYANTANAKNHASLLYKGSGSSSWHYSVDKNEVWQSFEDYQACWHAGDGNGQGNTTSIAIEICVNDRDNFVKACDKGANLAANLLKKHNLPIDRLVQHNKWSGKDCPKELRSGVWGINWDEFVKKVRLYMEDSQKPTPANEPSAWAKEAWEWGIEKGITDGTNPKNAATREEVVMMIKNTTKKQ